MSIEIAQQKIKEGYNVCVLGEAGTGKSTFLKVLLTHTRLLLHQQVVQR